MRFTCGRGIAVYAWQAGDTVAVTDLAATPVEHHRSSDTVSGEPRDAGSVTSQCPAPEWGPVPRGPPSTNLADFWGFLRKANGKITGRYGRITGPNMHTNLHTRGPTEPLGWYPAGTIDSRADMKTCSTRSHTGGGVNKDRAEPSAACAC